MNRFPQIAAVGLILVLCATVWLGCRPTIKLHPPASAKSEFTFTFNHSKDKAWSALVATFAKMSIPIRAIEKSSGLIASDAFKAQIGRDCNCGAIEARSTNKITGTARARLTAILSGGRTATLKINAIYTRRIRIYLGQGRARVYTIRCSSTGRLENLIYSKMVNRLK